MTRGFFVAGPPQDEKQPPRESRFKNKRLILLFLVNLKINQICLLIIIQQGQRFGWILKVVSMYSYVESAQVEPYRV